MDFRCEPRLFFPFSGRAKEFVEIVLSGTGKDPLPAHVSTKPLAKVMPEFGLKIVRWSKIGVPAFCRERMVRLSVPKQSRFSQASTGRDHSTVALGSGRSRCEHLEIFCTQLGESVSVGLQIVNEVNLAQAEFPLKHLRIDDPRQVWRFNAPFTHRPSNAEASGRDIVLILASEFKYSSIQTPIAVTLLDLFNDRAQTSVFLLKVSKSRAGTADVTREDHLQIPPVPTVSRHQFLGFPRSPCACWIVREFAWRQRFPYVEYRIDNCPAGFDHVGALEERGVADHAVVKEHFVSGLRGTAKVILIVETHVHRTDLHQRTGNLRAELERDSLFRLYVDHELVAREMLDVGITKKHKRRPLELDRDLGMATRHALASAQIDRDSCPTPVVDRELQRDEGLGS